MFDVSRALAHAKHLLYSRSLTQHQRTKWTMLVDSAWIARLKLKLLVILACGHVPSRTSLLVQKRRVLDRRLTVGDDVVRISIGVVDAEGNDGLIVDTELTRGQVNGNGEDQQAREGEMHRHGSESRRDGENSIGLIHRFEFE